MAEYFPEGGDTGSTTISNQLDRWILTQRLEASTLAGYSSAVKFWKGHLGSRPVKGLLHSEILTALAKRPDLTGKTVNNYVSVLRESMALAVADKVISSNPVAGVPRANHQKPQPDRFTQAAADAICAYMGKPYPDPVWNYMEFKFFTGIRASESFGIRWPNVDLPSKYAVISEGIDLEMQRMEAALSGKNSGKKAGKAGAI